MRKFNDMTRQMKELYIRGKLMKNKNLTIAQQDYVREHIEPKYENKCGPCRLNTMLYLDVPTELAFKILASGK